MQPSAPTLVTGATGLLGNNIVRQLVDRGSPVRVLVRAGSDPRPLAGLPVETAYGDVRHAQQVREACRGVGAVIHSAAVVHIGWSGLEASRAVNVEGTRTVAQAALDAGVPMVHVSSIDAIGLGSQDAPADERANQPVPVDCPYVVTKREAEDVVRALVDDGLHAVIVNPGFMLGPWDWKPSSGRMLLEVATRRTLAAPRGVNSFCDPRDVADGAIAALDKGRSGERYILSGESQSYLDAWRLFADVTGGFRPLFSPPGTLGMKLVGTLGDLRTRLTGREGNVNSAATAMADLPRYYTSRRAETELGYRCRPLRQSVEDAWRWFCEHGYVKGNKQPPQATAMRSAGAETPQCRKRHEAA